MGGFRKICAAVRGFLEVYELVFFQGESWSVAVVGFLGVCKEVLAGCSTDYLELCVCPYVFPLGFGLVAPYDYALFCVGFP